MAEDPRVVVRLGQLDPTPDEVAAAFGWATSASYIPYVCRTCEAQVSAAGRAGHLRWHQSLDAALADLRLRLADVAPDEDATPLDVLPDDGSLRRDGECSGEGGGVG